VYVIRVGFNLKFGIMPIIKTLQFRALIEVGKLSAYIFESYLRKYFELNKNQ